MSKLYESERCGIMKTDWLLARHVFSFGQFYDPARMGVGPLIVLNDDYIAAGTGFPAHPHRDMEIITIALEGELHHKDSTGGVGVLSNGRIQIMSAGTGVVHSEYNGGDTEAHTLQIWVRPKTAGLPPRYQDFNVGTPKLNQWLSLVEKGSERSIDADVNISRALIEAGSSIGFTQKRSGRSLFLYIISGKIDGSCFEQRDLARGDALLIREESFTLHAKERADVIVFELNESD